MTATTDILPSGILAPAYHFSVDDVFMSLVAPARDKGAVADRPVMRFLLNLAQAYGTRTDLYVFLRGADGQGAGDLRNLDERVCGELAGLDGLRFGPHAEDYATAPYAQNEEGQRRMLVEIYAGLARFCPPTRLSRWVRLHYFSECYEIAPELRARGVEALLLTDKPAVTYRLGEAQKAELLAKSWTSMNGLAFVRSHLRIERCVADGLSIAEACRHAEEISQRYGFVVLFTHEVDLVDARTRAMAEACIRSLSRAGARSI